MAAILTCMMFGAISGSGPAAVAAIGGLMIPMMSKIGYDKTFSAALIAAAGGLGVIIPPSIPMVMYGVTTGVSVSDLFAAGVVPGIISGLALMIYAYWYCKKIKPVIVWDEEEKGILTIINESKWSLLFPVIILGGIYGGIFTPTEAAAVAVFYALIISIFVTRQIKIKEVPQIFVESAASIGPLMFVVTAATVFGKILTLLQTPVIVAEALSKVTNNILILLLIINIFLLFVGAIMDTVAAIVILAPILLPLVEAYGVHPIHFGIIMVVNLAIGFITPPIGINLYVASGISNVPIMQIAKKALLPMVALGAALFLDFCVKVRGKEKKMYIFGIADPHTLGENEFILEKQLLEGTGIELRTYSCYSEEDVIKEMAECDYCGVVSVPFTRRVIENLPKCKGISDMELE